MAEFPLPASGAACKTCRFWINGLSDFYDYAQCRRRAPVRSERTFQGEVLPSGSCKKLEWPGRAEWPYTSHIDSCGDFEPSTGAKYQWEVAQS